ncbi:MAG TPA: PrsW family intramembrane metalloprotease [Candidatus Stackebrandtia faecavium]|nr:PrsW family intramembrane metalloprotease [Candidatus Stackebrandtia faecavium]
MTDVGRIVVEGQGTFVRVRRPAYWVYIGLVGYGLFSMGRMMSSAIETLSVSMWIAAMLNAVLAAVFIVLLDRMDLFEREPAAVRAAAFLWGALAATSLSLVTNSSLLSLITKIFGAKFATEWGAALAGPTNEEWFKLLGVVLLVLIVKEHFNRSIDGLIYGALVGLGFQVVENMIYAINYAMANPNSDIAGSVSVTLMRILVAGPWSHPVYTGVAGLGIAYLVTTKGKRSVARRYGTALVLYLAAWGAHMLWNAPLPTWLPDAVNVLMVYGKGIGILVFFMALYRYAATYEWHWFINIMADESEDIITSEEIGSMRTLGTRKRARKLADYSYGPHGDRLVARMQRAQLSLGEALARAQRAGGDPDKALDVVAARKNVLGIRAKLRDASRFAIRQG